MMTATPQGGIVSDHGDTGPALPTSMNVWRCWRCQNVIARLFLVPGCAIEIKCGKCHAFNTAALDKGNTKR